MARPRYATAKNKLIKVLIKTGQYDEAEEIIENVLNNSKNFLLFKKRIKAGDKENLEKFGPIITEQDREDLIGSLMTINIEKGYFEENTDLKNKYKKVVKQSSALQTLLGEFYRKYGNLLLAKRYLKAASKKENIDIETQERLIEEYTALGGYENFTNAIQLAETLAQTDTDREEEWNIKIANFYIERSREREPSKTIAGIIVTRQPKDKQIEMQVQDIIKAFTFANKIKDKNEKSSLLSIIESRRRNLEGQVSDALPLRFWNRKKTKEKRVNKRIKLMTDLLDLNINFVEETEDIADLDMNFIEETEDIVEIKYMIFELENLKDDNHASPESIKNIDKILSKAYRVHGDILMKIGRIRERCLKDYIKAIDLDSSNYKAYLAKAEICENMGNLEVAIESYEEAQKDAELEGDTLEITKKLIKLYQKMGNIERAEELAQKRKTGNRKAVLKALDLAKEKERVDKVIDKIHEYKRATAFRNRFEERIRIIKDKKLTSEKAKNFLKLDISLIKKTDNDIETLIAEIIQSIKLSPAPEASFLMNILCAEIAKGSSDTAIERLKAILNQANRENIPGREFIIMQLVQLSIEKEELEDARLYTYELPKFDTDYNLKIDYNLLHSDLSLKEGKTEEALTFWIEASTLYEKEAFSSFRDETKKEALINMANEIIKLFKSEKLPISEEIINRINNNLDNIKNIDDWDTALNLLELVPLKGKIENIVDISALLNDNTIPSDVKQKIISMLTNRLFAEKQSLRSKEINQIAKNISEYLKTEPSKQVWFLLWKSHYLTKNVFLRLKAIYIWVRLRIKERKMTLEKKDSSGYFNMAKNLIKKGKYKKAVNNLEKAVELNSEISEEEAYKKALFDARKGLVEKRKYKGSKEAQSKDKIQDLNSLLEVTYDNDTKIEISQKLIKAYNDLLAIYESGDKEIQEAYKTYDILIRERINIMQKLAEINVDIYQLNQAEDIYLNKIKPLDADNLAVKKGIETIKLYREIGIKDGDDLLKEEDIKTLIPEAYVTMAEQEKDVKIKISYFKKAMDIAKEGEKEYYEAAKKLIKLFIDEADFNSAVSLLDKILAVASKLMNTTEEKKLSELQDKVNKLEYAANLGLDISNLRSLVHNSRGEEEKLKRKRKNLRAKLSQKAKDALSLAELQEKYYRESIGDREDISDEDVERKLTPIENQLYRKYKKPKQGDANIKAVFKALSDKEKEAVKLRILKIGENLLTRNRLSELKELIFVVDKNNLFNDDIRLLQVKYLIARAKKTINKKESQWKRNLLSLEKDIESITGATSYIKSAYIEKPKIQRGEALDKAMTEFAEYYAYKARNLSGKSKDVAKDMEIMIYTNILYNSPFSITALRRILQFKDVKILQFRNPEELGEPLQLRDPKEGMLNHLSNIILNNPELSNESLENKAEIIQFLVNNWIWLSRDVGKPSVYKIDFDRMISNLGEINGAIATNLINFAFEMQQYDLVPKLLEKDYKTIDEYNGIMKTLNNNLSMLNVEQLEKVSIGMAILDDDNILDKNIDKTITQLAGDEYDRKALRSKFIIATAYLLMGRRSFDKAKVLALQAEERDIFSKLDKEAILVKLEIFGSNWGGPTKKLLNKVKDLSESDQIPIRMELKSRYDKRKKSQEALNQAIIVMNLFLRQNTRDAYEKAMSYYDDNIYARSDFYGYSNYDLQWKELEKLYEGAINSRRRIAAVSARAFEALTIDPAKIGDEFFGTDEKFGKKLKDEDGNQILENVDYVKNRIMESTDTYIKDFVVGDKKVKFFIENTLHDALKTRGIKFDDIIKRALSKYKESGEIPENIVISLFDKSTTLFEDHVGNGLIGINAYFLEMIQNVDTDTITALSVLGLSHELFHEINPEASEADALAFSREVLSEFTQNMQSSIMAKLSLIISPEGLEELRGVAIPIPLEPIVSPTAIIAVLTSDEEETLDAINETIKQNQDIHFVIIKRGDQAAISELNILEGPETRVLIDIEGISGKELSDTVKMAAVNSRKQSKIISFAKNYPDLMGLDVESVKALSDTNIIKVARMLTQGAILEETPLDNRLEALFDAYNPSISDLKAPEREVLFTEQEEIIRQNMQALAMPRADLTGLSVIEAMMTGYPPEMRQQVMQAHNNIAMAQNAESAAAKLFEDLGKQELITGKKAVVIDARNISNLDLSNMKQAILNLASKTFEAGILQICVITDSEENRLSNFIPKAQRPDNLVEIQWTNDGKTIEEKVQERFFEYNLDESDISVATSSLTSGEIVARLNKDSANFVIMGMPDRDETPDITNSITSMIPSIAAMNLISRVTQTQDMPSITIIGTEEWMQDISSRLEEKLKGISRLLTRVVRINIGKEIREYINAISQVAVSL